MAVGAIWPRVCGEEIVSGCLAAAVYFLHDFVRLVLRHFMAPRLHGKANGSDYYLVALECNVRRRPKLVGLL